MKDMDYLHQEGIMEKISNEFGLVQFGKVMVGNGERLLIKVPSSGEQVLLDPVLLTAIASLDTSQLSLLVQTVREK
jgi:hypothetical protein